MAPASSRTVAVIADTHLPRGSRRLPDACLERLRAVDLILHAGDLVSASFLEELRALGPTVHAVHGNMDEPSLRAELPARLVVDVAGTRVGMLHAPGPAAGREERLLKRFPGCAAVVFGHTHVPVVDKHGGVWLLNPGSPTERRRAPFRAMLVLDVAGGVLSPRLVRV